MILRSIDRAKRSFEWLKDSGQFIPYPATWLNAQGWHDEIACIGEVNPQSSEKLNEKKAELKNLADKVWESRVRQQTAAVA